MNDPKFIYMYTVPANGQAQEARAGFPTIYQANLSLWETQTKLH